MSLMVIQMIVRHVRDEGGRQANGGTPLLLKRVATDFHHTVLALVAYHRRHEFRLTVSIRRRETGRACCDSVAVFDGSQQSGGVTGSPKNLTQQPCCCRLTVGPGDAGNAQQVLWIVVDSQAQLTQSFCTAGNDRLRNRYRFQWPLDDDGRRSSSDRPINEAMPIELCAGNSDERATWPDVPTVAANASDGGIVV